MAWSKNSESERKIQAGEEPSRAAVGERVARLGSSLVVNGTLAGDEDLLIEGRVEGEISLRQNRVTVGEGGVVKADIFAKSIGVAGEVRGNLFGEDEVVIRRSGKVRGNVTAPRVSLEDGAKFKGSIDMQPGSAKKGTGVGAAATTGSTDSTGSTTAKSAAGRQDDAGAAAKRAGGAG